MGKYDKLLRQVLNGNADKNILFSDLCTLLVRLGFKMRTRGSHHIFTKPGVEERPNLQQDGNKAKAYQVKQIRGILLRHGLGEQL